jgi:hypothetical protein
MQPGALQAIRSLLLAEEEVFLARQILAEFWVVATRPADRNGLALTPEQAEAELARPVRVSRAAGHRCRVLGVADTGHDARRHRTPAV